MPGINNINPAQHVILGPKKSNITPDGATIIKLIIKNNLKNDTKKYMH